MINVIKLKKQMAQNLILSSSVNYIIVKETDDHCLLLFLITHA